MGNHSMKRKLGWAEAGLYLGGAILIAVFFYIRTDSDRQRAEGIEAFQQAVELQVQVEDNDTGENILATVAAPDLELWAEKRIGQYQESLKVEADPPIGIMSIDKLGIQVPVYNGTDDFNLNRGVGRIKGTAQIDVSGNLGIAGHRDGFFRGLKDITIGDEIELQTTRGLLTYAVSSITIVDPSDVSVLANTEEKTITLVTCYPFYYVGHAPQRYIVKATAEHLLASEK